MPLVKPDSDAHGAKIESLELRRVQLAGNDVDERRRAARALSGDPAAASVLAGRLACESDPRVREALFGSLVNIAGTLSAELVAEFIRSEDAGLRGGAIEALKQLEIDAVGSLDALLDDPDADVRLLAIEVTRAWPADLAMPRLRRVFDQEEHVNVCAAAVDVATTVGTGDLLDSLEALRDRFATEPFLVFAVEIAG